MLQAEFADVTISKIRFLEAEGLVTPARTASGYRKFSAADVERLRYVLAAQRDQYLPLKVIKEHLGAMDRGLRPPRAGGRHRGARARCRSRAGLPVAEDFGAYGTELKLTREELRAAAGHHRGTARPAGEPRPGGGPGQPLRRGRDPDRQAAAEFAPYGIEPRHLRPFRTAADREVGLIEQVSRPPPDRTDRGTGRPGRPVARGPGPLPPRRADRSTVHPGPARGWPAE